MNNLFKHVADINLKYRIIFGFGLSTVLIVFLMGWFSYQSTRRIYTDQLKEHVEVITKMVGDGINSRYLIFLSDNNENLSAHNFYRDYLENKTGVTGIKTFFIFNDNYDVILAIGKTVNSELLNINRSEINRLTVGKVITSTLFKGYDKQWYLWGFYKINNRFYIGVQEDASRLAYLDNLYITFVLIALAGILITLVLGWLIARSISKPVDKLINFSKAIGRRDKKIQIPDNVRGELAVLNKAMIEMHSDVSKHQQERENMLAQIAHEIRNPLAGIELYAGLISEDSQDKKIKEKSSLILNEVNHLKRYISSFLEYNKPIRANRELVDLNQLIKEVKEILKPQLDAKRIKLQIISSEKIIFDPGHLKQIFINLVKNSCEACNIDGKIEIDAVCNKESFKISISDSGKPLEEEIVNDIFKPFYTTKAGGSGLGLAICKKLCYENHADIFYEYSSEKKKSFVILQNTNGLQNGSL